MEVRGGGSTRLQPGEKDYPLLLPTKTCMWYQILKFQGMLRHHLSLAFKKVFSSLPGKCMAQAYAGLVFDKSNVISAMRGILALPAARF